MREDLRQRLAQGRQSGNKADGDESGDEAVLDRGSAGLCPSRTCLIILSMAASPSLMNRVCVREDAAARVKKTLEFKVNGRKNL